MKAVKPFVIEIKRNGRRSVAKDKLPLWDPDLLKSAAAADGEDGVEAAIPLKFE